MLPGGSRQFLPTLRHARGRSKRHLRPSPPGQPQVLAFVQGFSELLAAPALVCQSLTDNLLQYPNRENVANALDESDVLRRIASQRASQEDGGQV